MVSTHLKKILENGNLGPSRVENKEYLKPPPRSPWLKLTFLFLSQRWPAATSQPTPMPRCQKSHNRMLKVTAVVKSIITSHFWAMQLEATQRNSSHPNHFLNAMLSKPTTSVLLVGFFAKLYGLPLLWKYIFVHLHWSHTLCASDGCVSKLGTIKSVGFLR